MDQNSHRMLTRDRKRRYGNEPAGFQRLPEGKKRQRRKREKHINKDVAENISGSTVTESVAKNDRPDNHLLDNVDETQDSPEDVKIVESSGETKKPQSDNEVKDSSENKKNCGEENKNTSNDDEKYNPKDIVTPGQMFVCNNDGEIPRFYHLSWSMGYTLYLEATPSVNTRCFANGLTSGKTIYLPGIPDHDKAVVADVVSGESSLRIDIRKDSSTTLTLEPFDMRKYLEKNLAVLDRETMSRLYRDENPVCLFDLSETKGAIGTLGKIESVRGGTNPMFTFGAARTYLHNGNVSDSCEGWCTLPKPEDPVDENTNGSITKPARRLYFAYFSAPCSGRFQRIIICGKGGSGKDTFKAMASRIGGLSREVSFTSRKRRDTETNGIDYNFVSREKFEIMIKNHRFHEHTTFKGEYYGTTEKSFNERQVFIMTPGAIKSLNEQDRYESLVVYLTASDSTREERMRDRGCTEKSIDERLVADETDFDHFSSYDVLISNDETNLPGLERDCKNLMNVFAPRRELGKWDSGPLKSNIKRIFGRSHVPDAEKHMKLLEKYNNNVVDNGQENDTGIPILPTSSPTLLLSESSQILPMKSTGDITTTKKNGVHPSALKKVRSDCIIC